MGLVTSGPCKFTDDLTSKQFKVYISDDAYVKGIDRDCTLISMGKLIKQGWKFTFAELFAWTPSGHNSPGYKTRGGQSEMYFLTFVGVGVAKPQ